MTENQFDRTELLIGKEGINRLAEVSVAVFGIGGVGGHATEALVRAGIGKLTIIDSDVVTESNINRQIVALKSTVGLSKVLVMKDRIADINPNAVVIPIEKFYLPENSYEFELSKYDYILDAIDTVSAKVNLIVRAKNEGVPIISCMGAGNKLDPTRFQVADIYETSVCPLAKIMRKQLRDVGIENLKVVYSKEEPLKNRPTGSISFVPSVAGLIMAGQVVKDLLEFS